MCVCFFFVLFILTTKDNKYYASVSNKDPQSLSDRNSFSDAVTFLFSSNMLTDVDVLSKSLCGCSKSIFCLLQKVQCCFHHCRQQAWVYSLDTRSSSQPITRSLMASSERFGSLLQYPHSSMNQMCGIFRFIERPLDLQTCLPVTSRL